MQAAHSPADSNHRIGTAHQMNIAANIFHTREVDIVEFGGWQTVSRNMFAKRTSWRESDRHAFGLTNTFEAARSKVRQADGSACQQRLARTCDFSANRKSFFVSAINRLARRRARYRNLVFYSSPRFGNCFSVIGIA